MKDGPTYRITGRVIDARTARPLPGVRVELWDDDLIADDLVGSAQTGPDGRFEMSFDADYFRDLFRERSPDVFARVHDGDTCLLDTSEEQTWTLRPGTHEITLRVETERRESRGAFPFPFTLTSAAPLLDGPGGQELEVMPPGTRLVVLAVEGTGYRVDRGNAAGGWVSFDDFPALREAFDLLVGRRRPGPALDPSIREAVERAARELGHEESIAPLVRDHERLEALLGQAPAVRRQDFEGMARFDALMATLVDAFAPPPRPQAFTLTALRSEAAGIDIGSYRHGELRLPCLIDLDAIGRLGSAIYRSARGRWRTDPARVADELWNGYWVLGRLLGGVNRIASIFHALENGIGAAAPMSFPGGSPFGPPGAPPGQGPGGRPLPGPTPDPGAGWEPGRFPGFPGVPGFGAGCRVEQWERTIRALRCCGQTYRIDSVEPEADGAACAGQVVTIEGVGFSDGREWPTAHEESDTDPPHLGSPGPFENRVYFRAPGDGRVAATEYPEWRDDRVQVRVPEGAVSGPVEMRIFCERTLRGGAVDYVQCGFEMRLPSHDPADAYVLVGAGTLDVEVDGRGPGRDGRVAIEAEACTTVLILLRGENADRVRVTDDEGEEVALFEDLGGGRFTERVHVRSAFDESYTITMRDLCGDERTVPVEITRYRLVTPILPTPNFPAATTRTIPARIRLSCDPADLERESVDVLLSLGGDVPGVSLRDAVVRVEAGSREVPTTLDVAPFACGTGTLEARVLPPAPAHRPGDAPFQILGQPLAATFNGTASVRITDPRIPAMTVALTGVALSFPINRRGIVITSFPSVTTATFSTTAPAPCDSTSVTVTLLTGGTGTYDCSSGAIGSLAVTLRFDLSTFCAGDSTLPLVLTTGTVTSPSGALTGGGSQVDAAGNVTVVGVGTFVGGWLGGSGPSAPSPAAECLITLTGTITPVPPPCCAG